MTFTNLIEEREFYNDKNYSYITTLALCISVSACQHEDNEIDSNNSDLSTEENENNDGGMPPEGGQPPEGIDMQPMQSTLTVEEAETIEENLISDVGYTATVYQRI